MRPRFVQLFETALGTGVFVPDYALLQAVSIVLGIYLAVHTAARNGLDAEKVFRTCLLTVAGALIGARLYIVLRHAGYYSAHLVETLFFWQGGTASVGAYLGGGVAAMAVAKWQNLPASKFYDASAPSVALAIALGRVGCFVNGCCFGRVSELPWALRFPEGSGPYFAQLRAGLIAPHALSLPVHPTQLYEALYAFSLFFILLAYKKYQKRDGQLIALLAILYPLGRFLNEFLRGDDRGSVLGLSLPQIFSIVMLIVGVSLMIWKNREVCKVAKQRRRIPGVAASGLQREETEARTNRGI